MSITNIYDLGASYFTNMCSNAVGDKLAAIGSNEYDYTPYIGTSSDGGVTWNDRSNGPANWKSICSNAVGDKLAACAYGGNIWTSSNSGETWNDRSIGPANWGSICSNAVGDKLAACIAYENIWTSPNSGQNWTRRQFLYGDGAVLKSNVVVYNNSGHNLYIGTYRDVFTLFSYSVASLVSYSTVYLYNGVCLDDLLYTKTLNNNNTLTNYKINGTEIQYTKPFNSGTDNASPTTPLYITFPNYNNNTQFTPKMDIFPDAGTYTYYIPANITKMFVVCIGGGGGGGGGGTKTGGSTNGGSGGGGAGGALNGWWINYQSGVNVYNGTVGVGGTYGKPSGNTTVAEGIIATAGSAVKGASGGTGGASSFVYNNTTYSSEGGSGGGGGAGSNNNSIGAGGIQTTLDATSNIKQTGSSGVAGTNNNAASQPGGAGGASGNKGSTNTFYLVNYNILNTYDSFGKGGAGGTGESAADYGGAGYNGIRGCVMVFYYF